MNAPVPVERLMIRAGASHPDRLARLEDELGLFARRLGASLAAFCGGAVEVRAIGVEHVPLSAAGATPEDAVAASARRGAGLLRLRIEPAALHALIAIWSRDEGAARPAEALTAIERRMALRLCDRMFELLATCLASSGAAPSAPAVLEVPDDDPPGAFGARAHLELSLQGLRHALWVVVPHDGIGAGGAASQPSRAIGAPVPSPGLARRIGAAQVTLSAVLGGGRARLGDTFGWEPGTVVDLGIDRAQRIDLCWDGRPLFHGVAGRRRSGRMALRVVERAETQGDAS